MAKKELFFHIEGTTPHTFPMARLADYIAELAALLGHKKKVHFLRVEQGSQNCVIEIEDNIAQSVYSRVKKAISNKGPREAVKANSSIRAMLKRDRFSAELKQQEGDVVVSYPLVKESSQETVGPILQDGSLDGILVRLGGIDDTLPVHLVYEGRQYICNANREIVRRLGTHIWGSPIRVHGEGKWFRNAQGTWELQFFDIHSFVPLEELNLVDAVTRLRAIPDNGLFALKDPLAEMQKLRDNGE